MGIKEGLFQRIRAIPAGAFAFSASEIALRKWSRSDLTQAAAVDPGPSGEWRLAFGANDSVYGCIDGVTRRWAASDLSLQADRALGFDRGLPVYGDDHLYVANDYADSKARELWKLDPGTLATVDSYEIAPLGSASADDIDLMSWTEVNGHLYALWSQQNFDGNPGDPVVVDKIDVSTMSRVGQVHMSERTFSTTDEASIVFDDDGAGVFARYLAQEEGTFNSLGWFTERIDPGSMAITNATSFADQGFPMCALPGGLIAAITGTGEITVFNSADLSVARTVLSAADYLSVVEIAADGDGFLYKPDGNGVIEKIDTVADTVVGVFDVHEGRSVYNVCVDQSIPEILGIT